ncbi:hypothetical protein [Flavobacterium sp. 3HN19-14]|uniref:hypothetical protein n=1 Tax=Flavobacterium sp. 3HN19-14 TaxID=3448133 RepID=UPI003EE18124
MTYFENAVNALNNQSALTTYTNTSNPQHIIAKITNNITGCSSNSTLSLFVNTSPPQNAIIEECDVLGQENGFTTFDLSESNFTLAPTETVTYYATLEDALLEQLPIPVNYPNTNPYNQTVYARIEDGNDCSVINAITLIVNKLPDIDTESEGDDFVCNNLPGRYITIDAAVLDPFPAGLSYVWHYNGNPYPRTTYSIQVNKAGVYTVDVYNLKGCFKTRTITVVASSDANIASIDVQDITPEDNNTVTINLTADSVGEYEYSIDNPFGPFQASNFFEHVIPGIHEAYINDVNGCG